VLLGHDEKLVRRHVDEILDFAELTEYSEEPTKTLSSGMNARLCFAIATQFRPDLILVDEVLAVGDERFRRKCQARISRFWDEHSTILLVSHDMWQVSQLCDRVIWLDHGKIRFDGPSAQAEKLYLSTVPSVANFRRGEDLVQLAETSHRGEVVVRGTSGHPQLFLVKDGRRHFIASLEWCERQQYVESDVTLVEDSVILEIPEGEILR
jgi:ABC-type multidrug transport system ATPase subunit